ncbi:hypothetical protein ACFQ5D_02510 [Paenibacillus farraposensis]|uniref:Uncharacterized protein n=1 Tax=Paenibacillus farraposensis TaxID=2807095 RepID=A0ABW4D9H7_9BACL|nr:hypothetical protein [Paenibacillus farraposensis]MCC3381771.1 hypothetical protein [Paenibacillus farraposensis]
MIDEQKRLSLFSPSVPTGVTQREISFRNHSVEDLQQRKVQLGKTIYIVQSCYIGKDTLRDKIRRLVLRKWEDEQH